MEKLASLKYVASPLFLILFVLFLVWGCSALTGGPKEDPGYGNEGCPYVGPGGC